MVILVCMQVRMYAHAYVPVVQSEPVHPVAQEHVPGLVQVPPL